MNEVMIRAAFTICAKNYIGLAETLGESIKQRNPDVDYYIFVSDEFSAEEAIKGLADNVLIAKNTIDISQKEWVEMSFKYDLTEFATAIKPACFKYIFEQKNAATCIFFDPDILVFNNLDVVYDKLIDHSILLTPHITSIEKVYTGSLNERSLLYSGMYNLGFLALKYDQDTKQLLDWWDVRLKDRCFQNVTENYFTDQKWMDFIPSFFPTQTIVSPDLGLNVAPWNFYEREVFSENDKYYVKSRIPNSRKEVYPLTFVHFSGFDYRSLLKDEINQGKIKGLEVPVDILPLLTEYTNWIRQSGFSKFIELNYTYSYFSNKALITSTYRKLYRRLLEDGKIHSNPFNVYNEFYLALKKNGLVNDKMIASDKTSINNVANANGKLLYMNKFFTLIYKLLGAQRFFLLMRSMRLYSKIENHVYLIDKSYTKEFQLKS